MFPSVEERTKKKERVKVMAATKKRETKVCTMCSKVFRIGVNRHDVCATCDRRNKEVKL